MLRTRYRVLQHEYLMPDGKLFVEYLPQWKKFLMWHNFAGECDPFGTTVSFDNYDEAASFIVTLRRLGGRDCDKVVKEWTEVK